MPPASQCQWRAGLRSPLRGLRIGASTVSIVELLRNDWTGGISAGVAWLVFLQVERRLPAVAQEPEG
jgi:hypothetical protein